MARAARGASAEDRRAHSRPVRGPRRRWTERKVQQNRREVWTWARERNHERRPFATADRALAHDHRHGVRAARVVHDVEPDPCATRRARAADSTRHATERARDYRRG